jgi:TPR repeat protein
MFSWFKKTKSNDEENIQLELSRFEQYNEKQQSRLDEANQALITSLKQAQVNQSSIQNNQIEQLKSDVEYYRQQITKQQTTIEELSGRYDAVMGCLLEEKRKEIKNVFSDDDFIRIQPSELIPEHVNDEKSDQLQTQKNNNHETSTSTETIDSVVDAADISNETDVNSTTKEVEVAPFKEDDLLFDQAILQRKTGDSEQAFLLFEQAAKQGHIKAMGAMGRSFFLGEGTPEDHSLGLAWLINAANHNLPQALDRVKHFQESDPKLYQEALELSEKLA